MSPAVRGRGLHTGVPSSVRFERCAGPVVVRAAGRDTRIEDLHALDSARSTTVRLPDGTTIATVEHVFAALGGLGIRSGIAVTVEGGEMPLADGGARVYADVLGALDVPASPPALRVVRDGVIETGASRYEFVVNADASATTLEVHIDFGDARIAETASWHGDPSDFLERIAPARTFGFEHELDDLLARGLASHVTPESVVLFGEGRVLARGRAYSADEPARHKLLDLVGDLYLHGGPPRGNIRVVRPGHSATHEVMRRALDIGLVVREER